MISGLLACYVALRILGRFAGCMLGGGLVGWPRARRGWFGLALMPQAGVALGMALVASDRMPELAAVVLPVVIASTVFFELVGPVLTRTALERAT
jgi:Kef-type K+ transport system membrane component KefB